MDEKITNNQTIDVKTLNDLDYVRVQFFGKRTLDEMVKKWFDIKQSIHYSSKKLLIEDIMHGKLNNNEISYLITTFDGYNYYKQVKIAVILHERESYNHRLFDCVAKCCRICIKHFTEEVTAINWLTMNVKE